MSPQIQGQARGPERGSTARCRSLWGACPNHTPWTPCGGGDSKQLRLDRIPEAPGPSALVTAADNSSFQQHQTQSSSRNFRDKVPVRDLRPLGFILKDKILVVISNFCKCR